jgi:hypothetical protein
MDLRAYLKVSKAAENVLGVTGHRNARRAHWTALRNIAAAAQRRHKTGGHYMLPGGGGKNPRPPRPDKIMTRTGTLKKSYGIMMAPRTKQAVGISGNIAASYGSDLNYAKHLEVGTSRISPRKTLEGVHRDISPQLDKTLSIALAREGF